VTLLPTGGPDEGTGVGVVVGVGVGVGTAARYGDCDVNKTGNRSFPPVAVGLIATPVRICKSLSYQQSRISVLSLKLASYQVAVILPNLLIKLSFP
jgi:hypothetical protein